LNHYYTSKGERVSQSEIDRKIREAKKKKLLSFFDKNGYYYCEDCNRSNTWLDCSHDVSVDECKKSGNTELSWNVNNITIRCRECHQKHDKLN